MVSVASNLTKQLFKEELCNRSIHRAFFNWENLDPAFGQPDMSKREPRGKSSVCQRSGDRGTSFIARTSSRIRSTHGRSSGTE